MNASRKQLDRNPWLGVTSLALGSFASVTTEFLPIGLLPDIAKSFEISAGEAGLMMTLPGIFAALAAPGVMIGAGKMDRKLLMIVLTGMLLVAGLFSALAPSYFVMLMGRAITGISLGAFWAMSLAVAGSLVAKEKANQAVAAVFGGVTAAMILGVPLGTFVAGLGDWRMSFMAAGVITTVALVMQCLFLPPIPAEKSLKPGSLLDFVKIKTAQKSLALVALLFATHFGTYTYLAPLLSEHDISPDIITWSLLGFGLAGFVSNFAASAFIAKNLRATLTTTMVLMLAALLLMGFAQTVPVLIVAVLVWGMAWGAMPLCLNIFNRQASETNVESGSAMFTLTTQVAIAIGSSAGGIIVDTFGTRHDFVIGAAVVIFSMLLMYLWQPPKPTLNAVCERY